MNWLFLALLAPALFGVGNFFDKVIIGKFKDPYNYTIIGGLLFIINLLLLPLAVWPVPIGLALIAFAIGMLRIFAYFPFLKALQMEEASKVIPLTLSGPIFVLLLSIAFLGEKLKGGHFLAFFLVLIGSLLIVTANFRDLFKPSKVFWIITISNLAYAITDVVVKYLSTMNIWTLLFISGMGEVTGGVVMLLARGNLQPFMIELKSVSKRTWLIIITAISFYFLATIAFYIAVQGGLVSLVAVLYSAVAFFVLVYCFIASKLFPGFLNEKFDTTSASKKIIATLLIFGGVAIIYFA